MIVFVVLADINLILQEVQAKLRQLEDEEREKERQRRIAEENRNRILPRPEPVQRVSTYPDLLADRISPQSAITEFRCDFDPNVLNSSNYHVYSAYRHRLSQRGPHPSNQWRRLPDKPRLHSKPRPLRMKDHRRRSQRRRVKGRSRFLRTCSSVLHLLLLLLPL